MVFTSNIFNGASKQAISSQASFNEDEAQNMKAPVYSQAFDEGNKEEDLFLTPNPYGFDLFNSHLSLALPSLTYPPPHKLPTNQPIRIATVVIHMCAVFQERVDLASNKDNMLKSDNVWLAGDTVS
ncbi:hypothetical protein DSO57_1021376 [Entomophthora muscae]|uniref:Uncharacterized protein n=1 Tax=Entomophthora muscae TaxID=34485 RepID=A0ACC2UPC7_9FUNG|nr:hypothetical protein DSO57_1021376 [Entomophthora muscae]